MPTPKEFNFKSAPLTPGFRSIEAGAGTGKTYSLIWVVVRLLLQEKKQAREILMVTFTEAACLEMRQRLREMLEAIESGSTTGNDAAVLKEIREAVGISTEKAKEIAGKALNQLGRMSITTIHGFCQAAFAEHAVNSGFAPMAGSPVDGGVIAESIASDWVRSGGSGDESVSTIAQAVRVLMADPSCKVDSLKDGSALKTFVANRIANEQTVTFDDLILRLRNALLPEKATGDVNPNDLPDQLERARELKEHLRAAYTCCLIDEFQDTDAAQWDIFQHLFGADEATKEGALLLVVGDPKQAIYGFRGADLHTYLKAVQASEGRKGSTLLGNFRSSPEMIGFFNAIFGHQNFFGSNAKVAITHELAKHKTNPEPPETPSHKPVRLIEGNDPYAVANEVVRLLASQPPGMTIGVLVRSNSHGNTLHRALVEAKVPAALESTQSVYETTTAFQAFLLLRAALRPGDASARKSLLVSRPALFGNLPSNILDVSADQSDDKVLAIHNDLAEWLGKCNKAWTEYGFTSCWEKLTRTSPRNGITSVRETLARSAFRSRALIDLTHVGEHLAFTQANRRLDPDQLLNYLQLKVEQADMEEEGDSEAAPDECLRLESARPQVVVQTIHKSKGLEYDSVVLVLKNPKNAPTFPGNVLRSEGSHELTVGDKKTKKNQDKNLSLLAQTRDEDARLLYVAITRAKNHLTIFNDKIAEDPTKEYGFHKVLRSSGIDPASWTTYEDHKAPKGAPALDDLVEGHAPDAKKKTVSNKIDKETATKTEGPALITADKEQQKDQLREVRGWSSYSGLTKNHSKKKPKEPENRAEDEGDDDENDGKIPPINAKLMIRDDIKGTDFGTVIHEILEIIDFKKGGADPDKLSQDIEAKLIEQQVRLPAGAPDWKSISKELASSCRIWLDTPLLVGPDEPGHKIKELERNRCLHEVRFAMRGQCNENKLKQLASAFEEEFEKGSPLAKLKLGKIELDGILTGVIDLAYEHQGRFYILDWKTNHLGTHENDYDHAGLVNGVAAHSYQIQFSLYAAALDLYLQQVYGDRWEYDPAKAKPGQFCFGGVQYVFLRAFGLKPDGLGCYYHLPKRKFINKIQTILTA
jgi:exodeoxyribonuclease V beta subunit